MKNIEKTILAILFLGVIYFPIFLHLDHMSINRWDEATNALQAFEMSENGNYLRRFFLGRPDTWETKPPLLTWLQVFFMKLIGYNELAVRLPSALAVLGTVLIVFRFFVKELHLVCGGVFSAFVLLTSSGYVRTHVSRTGDHDALLIFFLMSGLIYFYKFLNYPEQKKKYLSIFTIALIGGVMTKSITGLYFAPALLLFTIVDKKLISTLRWKGFYLAIFSFFFVVGGYYLLNEHYYPGYLMQVWENELFPRFFNTAETYDYNQMPEPYYFTKILYRENFKWYYMFLPFSLILVWFHNNKRLKNFTLLILITALTFHLVVSNGTFNNWYDAPIYPLLAILVGTGLALSYEALIKYLDLEKKWKKYLFTIGFCLSLFLFPYKNIIQDQCYFPKTFSPDAKYGAFFKKLKNEQANLKDFFVYYEPNNRHFLFYSNVYNKHYNYKIRSCGSGTGIKNCKPYQQAQIGNKVMVCNHNIMKELNEQFEVKEVMNYDGCKLYEVIAKKREELEVESQ